MLLNTLAVMAALTGCGAFEEREALVVAVDSWLRNASDAEATYGPISSWNTARVRDMSELFCYDYFCSHSRAAAKFFDGDVSSWDTSNVTRMDKMFRGSVEFDQDLGFWDTSKVVSTASMFRGAEAFGQNISGWRTSNLVSADYMFRGASAFNQDLGGWDTTSLRSAVQMFYSASRFNSDLSSWSVAGLWSMQDMFAFAEDFNQSLGWATDPPCRAFRATACEGTSCGVECDDDDDGPSSEAYGYDRRRRVGTSAFFRGLVIILAGTLGSFLVIFCCSGVLCERWQKGARVHIKWRDDEDDAY